MGSREEEITRLFKGIQEQLDQDWNRFRDQHHNPSNKGASYEETLKAFLEKYYSGVYEIRTQATIIDQDLAVFDKFDTARGENEIDVVGLFESARPRIVFEIEDMTYVPLKGAAFLCEVKSELDAGRLESDLAKLEKVTELIDKESERWGVAQTGEYTTNHQLRCLVYDENSISDEQLVDSLIDFNNAWDLLLVVESNRLYVNSSLPIFKDIRQPIADIDLDNISSQNVESPPDLEEDLDVVIEDLKMTVHRERNLTRQKEGLVMFLVILSGSIPRPVGVDTTDTLRQLLIEYQEMLAEKSIQD